MLSRAEALAAIAACRRCVAVSGTHGKTTTTSMLALILVEAGLRPSFLIGGDINEIGTNAVWDAGEWLVIEADESDGTFLDLDPEMAVVTNVEPDHLDHYGGFDQLVAAFDRFCLGRRAGWWPAPTTPWRPSWAGPTAPIWWGPRPDATYRIEDLETGERRVVRPVGPAARSWAASRCRSRGPTSPATRPWPWRRPARGAPFDAAERALARFAGVARRFEARGEADGRALRRRLRPSAHRGGRGASKRRARPTPGRLVVVFQPHRYSRIAALGEQFADAFTGADVVVVTDMFAAGETPLPGVTGRVVADAVRRAHPALDVTYIPGRAELRAHLAGAARAGRPVPDPGRGRPDSLPDELQATPPW